MSSFKRTDEVLRGVLEQAKAAVKQLQDNAHVAPKEGKIHQGKGKVRREQIEAAVRQLVEQGAFIPALNEAAKADLIDVVVPGKD